MPLQNSGVPISLDDIATEFGGTVPHSLSEYYGADTGIPTAGNPISLGDFYGASSALTISISSNQVDFNLFNWLDGQGQSGKGIYTITINSGVTISSSSSRIPAFDVGSGWSAAQSITIINNGYIRGAGGQGRLEETFGDQNGGTCIYTRKDITLNNASGYLYAGGGGGGLGANSGVLYGGSGGGGGAGTTPGPAGKGYLGSATGGNDGSPGTTTTGGAGGPRYYSACGAGGAGGNLGQPGIKGDDGYNETGWAGGRGGYSIDGKSHVNITAGNNTTRIKGSQVN